MAESYTESSSKAFSICMLGRFSLSRDDILIADKMNRSQKLWEALAYLIIHRDRTIPQSELIEVFWPEGDSVNPAGALKTLLSRIRSMLEPLFGKGCSPIVSHRGVYAWNRNIPCVLDIEQFETLCQRSGEETLSEEERTLLCHQALALYEGDLLPQLNTALWLIPYAVRYHSLYLNTVKRCAALLAQSGAYDEIADVCTRAIQIDSLDEELHILMIRALIKQGKNIAALNHYESTTEMLYRNLSVQPSKELRSLYDEIMKIEKHQETDLGIIQQELWETASRPGAFFCEYGFFREIYRLEVRRSLRSGSLNHICLLTITTPTGGTPSLDLLSSYMDHLKEILLGCLRQGDVVARYSGSQYLVMLPGANFEDSNMVMERIVTAFFHQSRRHLLKITYKVRDFMMGYRP